MDKVKTIALADRDNRKSGLTVRVGYNTDKLSVHPLGSDPQPGTLAAEDWRACFLIPEKKNRLCGRRFLGFMIVALS